MKELEELTVPDFPATIRVGASYNMSYEPDLTRENFIFLIDEHNKVVERVNELMKIITFEPEVL